MSKFVRPMRVYLSILLLLAIYSGFGQRIRDTSINVPMVGVHFCGELPFGDLQQRFGNNLAVGGSFLFKASRTWVAGIDGSYFFSRSVRENVLSQMKNTDGFVVDNEGFPADLRVFERGFNLYAVVGKVFKKTGSNPNCGIITNLGFGYLQHKIKLYDAQQKIAAVKGDLKKGYDRLSGGFSMHQYIGYLYLSDNRLINFDIGFEFYEAFTKSYRGFNYDTQQPDTKLRFDGLMGIRVAWILPLYKRTKDFYYN